nr:MAG: C-5 cytosine-specific DNA methylase [Bacteriophage sp.]
MKFIDFFAGIGGFRRGMELAGHECVGFCEFDKFATASYISMHLLTEEQRKALEDIPIKKRQKEILKEEYRNGEWYANDIRRVYAGDIPKADCWCFGFPCQDISVAENVVEIWNGLNTIRRKSNARSVDIQYIQNLMSLTAMRLRIRRRTQNVNQKSE